MRESEAFGSVFSVVCLFISLHLKLNVYQKSDAYETPTICYSVKKSQFPGTLVHVHIATVYIVMLTLCVQI